MPPCPVAAQRDDVDLPALPLGVAAVHAEHLGREERRLVAARAGADLEQHVLVVVRVLGHEQQRDLGVERVALRLERARLLVRHLAQLRVVLAPWPSPGPWRAPGARPCRSDSARRSARSPSPRARASGRRKGPGTTAGSDICASTSAKRDSMSRSFSKVIPSMTVARGRWGGLRPSRRLSWCWPWPRAWWRRTFG